MWGRAKILSSSWAWTGVCALGFVTVAALTFYVTTPLGQVPEVQTETNAGMQAKMADQSRQGRGLFDSTAPTPTRMSSFRPSTLAEQAPRVLSPRFSALASQVQSEALRKVLGLEGNGSLSLRLKNLSLLKFPLSASDQRMLNGFLASSAKVDGLSDPALHALKDGIMVILTGNSQNLSETTEVLRGMYLDPSQDPVVRSYAMQYLASSLPKLTDPIQRAALQQLVQRVAADPTQAGSGAALLGLEQVLDYKKGSLTQTQVSQLALETALNANLPEMERLHPLLVCGQNNVEAAAPAARNLAISASHAMVRMGALATLGKIGDSSDLQLLTSAADNPDQRISYAASTALAELKSRLSP